jgi:hypothetical protein
MGVGSERAPASRDLLSRQVSACHERNFPYPAVIFDGQLKTRKAPGTSFEPYPIRPGRPKKDHPCARSFAFPAAHHTSTASEFSLVLSTRSDSFKLRL